MIRKLRQSRVARNAGWMIAGRIIQMVLSFFVGLMTARYLGPSNYGLINYAGTYTTFFASLCTLGINSVIVNHLITHPGEEGKTLCTTIVLRALSSITSLVAILGISSVVDHGEPTTRMVVFLCALGMVFQIVDTFNYWFQAKLKSKCSAIATLVAYIVVTAYRIALLIFKKNIIWFAFATTIDHIVVACIMAFFYKRNNGPAFAFSWDKAKQLLSESHHFIWASIMVAVYGSTDRFMLKHMIGETSVGYYATALTLCNMWVFILTAIIDSIAPTIMQAYGTDSQSYQKKNRQMYAIVFYLSAMVSFGFMIFGKPIILILYGEAYRGAIVPLKLITWYTAFSYLGVARNTWIVCEHKQKYLKYLYSGAAVTNVVMNAVLIPNLGASGAALASLLTQISTIFIFPAFIRALRPNIKLIIESIRLKDVIEKKEEEEQMFGR